MDSKQTSLRLKGHAADYATGNGVCVKPTCKCGWIGRAATPRNARHLYRQHLQAAQASIAKATGEQA